jgi:dTDP-4-amino-4,6-dideoxygalactose transaminase
MQAAVLRVKLERLDDWNARRRSIATRYSAEIANPRVTCPPRRTTDDYVAHLYVVRSAMREQLRAHLSARRVPSDIHYPLPDYAQPAIAHLFPDASNPIAEAACREVVTLPCFPEMTDDEVAMVIAAVNDWV